MVEKEKFKEILAALQQISNITFFAALKMDDYINSWSIAICGDNLKPRDSESFSKVVKVFDNLLTDTEMNSIARIGIFEERDYIPQLFAEYKNDTEILKEKKINGFVVYEGYILISDIKPQ